MMRDAVISVEDKRFWTDPGVDIRGFAPGVRRRRLRQRTPGCVDDRRSSSSRTRSPRRPTGRSSRSCARRRSPTTSRASGRRTKILTEYLNSIYFGNGAYGAESAARVYFGKRHGYNPNARRAVPGRDAVTPRSARCASRLSPGEAALLAGMVANPSAFNPIAFPERRPRPARSRALATCSAQHSITRAQYEQAQQRAAADRQRHRAARGATGGPLLHQLARPADPRRAGARPGCRPRSPSTAPTTAG